MASNFSKILQQLAMLYFVYFDTTLFFSLTTVFATG